MGPNNSGKSSILAAAEWALTGRNAWTDRAGRGSGDLIARGARECQVGLELDGFGSVVRGMPPHTLAAGRHQGIQEAQASIYHHLGADERLLQLALNAGAFANLAPADQKAFLFALGGVSFDCGQITAAAEDWLLQSGAPPALAKEAAGRVKSLFPGGVTGSPGVLEAMGKKAREMRRETKRDLERTRAALAETVLPELPEGVGLEDKDEVVAQIQELEADLNSMLQALGARQAAGRGLEGMKNKISALEEELAGLARSREAKVAVLKGAGPGELEREAAGARVRLEQADRLLAEFSREVARIKGVIESRQQVIGRLQGFDGRCPLAPEHVSCAMDVDKVKKLSASLAEEVKTDLQKARDLEGEIQKLQGEKTRARAIIARLELEQAELASLGREIAGLNEAARRREGDLAGLRGDLAELEEAAHSPAADPGELSRLQERIGRGRNLLRQLELAGHGRRQAAQLQSDLKELQHEADILEHLVRALGPDGVKKDLLGDRLAGFTSQLNSHLQAFTGGSYCLAWDEDYTPVIQQNSHALPVRLLSKSEQFRVGVAVQAAIARAAGLKFLAVDEVDILDQDNRDLLTVSLLEALDEFEQILLFCTAGEVEPPSPGLPGVKIFRVEAGAVTELKGAGGS